jgi:hypothetical protein
VENQTIDSDRAQESKRKRFQLSTWVNVFTLIGLPTSVFFYLASIREPNVTYALNPIRVAVVRSGISSDLSILYKGTEIQKNVTSVSVEIWNAGKAAVHRSAVLEPLKLTLPDGNRILEAHVVKLSRPVVQL